ncbi:Mu transposase domain-containing protein [Nonomuraea sp. SYSU D8015]|uniref:Mu transposase domain-containing protein n=1 Tax=Nonomuraea sp. SYSU D8015 TaxID=2593644 RepID=UPI0016606C8D|nr:hypothetical protein [Nonomuraea sp. SYSU D8015]
MEATVRLAKADPAPTEANLRSQYGSFAELAGQCRTWCEKINACRHRGSGQIPAEQLLIEQQALHVLPAEPFALALGEQRIVYDDQTISFASVRYSTPPGHIDTKVWVRVVGEELVVTARAADRELTEIARRRVSVPGNPQILAQHYAHHPNGRSVHQPNPGPRSEAEVAFLGIGPGAKRWLTEAGRAGALRIRAKMARAVELAVRAVRFEVEHPPDPADRRLR